MAGKNIGLVRCTNRERILIQKCIDIRFYTF